MTQSSHVSRYHYKRMINIFHFTKSFSLGLVTSVGLGAVGEALRRAGGASNTPSGLFK